MEQKCASGFGFLHPFPFSQIHPGRRMRMHGHIISTKMVLKQQLLLEIVEFRHGHLPEPATMCSVLIWIPPVSLS